jgi:fibronectin type 3 domain-containing protein
MKKLITILCLTMLSFTVCMQAAAGDTLKIVLRANATQSKIQLRWAATSSAAWHHTNRNGFSLVRYTIMRDSTVLDIPEKTVLDDVIKAQPLDNWQYIAPTDNYAAIIAQALYGSDFEVSGGEQDISRIIALSQEQEQRYAMSLVAAEMSFPAAMFAGWGYEDFTAKKGERYLYQVVPLNTTTEQQVEPGVAYISLNDYSELPKPLDFTALWGNGSVLLTWDYKNMLPFFSSYQLERSADNRLFSPVSQTALSNMMNSDRMFYTDSIANGTTYYYRLQGINAFGDKSQYSDTLSGKGVSRLAYVPFIKGAMPDDKGGVDIEWEFDERGNAEIKGFELRQSVSTDSIYTTAVSNIAPSARSVHYSTPLPEGYLMLAAIPHEGEERLSFPHLLQMTDSIPPAIPTGLQGTVDTLGVARVSWKRNSEADFYGYRIYRAQSKGGELIPLNNDAHRDTVFTDTIGIHNLNATVYYAVASLDKRYNQSALSDTLEIEKPEMVKPAAPYISKGEATASGVSLQWAGGKDERIGAFHIYRREDGSPEATRIAEITVADIHTYTDTTAVGGTNYLYYIRSVTKKGLASDASPDMAVRARTAAGDNETGITELKATRTSAGVAISWQHNVMNVRTVSLYRRAGDEPLSLWQEADSADYETADLTAQRNVAYEYMLVIKDRTGKVFSKNVNVK